MSKVSIVLDLFLVIFISFSNLYGQLVEATVGLVEASGFGPSAIKEDEEPVGAYAEVEVEYNDPFCKLTYAQHTETVAPEVTNFKGLLKQVFRL